jgi:entericidin B
MRKNLYSIITAAALIAGAGALAACNTMAGAGEDMQHGGAALTGSAEKHGADTTPPGPTGQVAPAPASQ